MKLSLKLEDLANGTMDRLQELNLVKHIKELVPVSVIRDRFVYVRKTILNSIYDDAEAYGILIDAWYNVFMANNGKRLKVYNKAASGLMHYMFVVFSNAVKDARNAYIRDIKSFTPCDIQDYQINKVSSIKSVDTEYVEHLRLTLQSYRQAITDIQNAVKSVINAEAEINKLTKAIDKLEQDIILETGQVAYKCVTNDDLYESTDDIAELEHIDMLSAFTQTLTDKELLVFVGRYSEIGDNDLATFFMCREVIGIKRHIQEKFRRFFSDDCALLNEADKHNGIIRIKQIADRALITKELKKAVIDFPVTNVRDRLLKAYFEVA